MKKSINQLFVVLFITTIFSSCGADMFNRVIGNKNVIVKQRTLNDNFSGIKVSSGIDLYISQGDTKISVRADENLHDLIITEVNDGVLNIYVEKNIWRSKSKKVYVTLENLNLLKATSGSDVYSETIIRTKEISVSATSGADINIEVEAQNVETRATSGSDIKIFGTAINLAASATSGSSIDAFDLESKNVIAKATSGADVDVYASEKIEANATSGGDIDFRGNPTVVNKKSSSGGSISKK
tara:strand:+ start:18715 stop:19437 length:723 start_codon:yes stop_codon:yes gene_type:complete